MADRWRKRQASFETQHLQVKRSHPSRETKLIQHDIQLQHLLCRSVQSSPEQRVLVVLLISGKGGYWADNGLELCEFVNSPASKKRFERRATNSEKLRDIM